MRLEFKRTRTEPKEAKMRFVNPVLVTVLTLLVQLTVSDRVSAEALECHLCDLRYNSYRRWNTHCPFSMGNDFNNQQRKNAQILAAW